jgi:hypothetical protein
MTKTFFTLKRCLKRFSQSTVCLKVSTVTSCPLTYKRIVKDHVIDLKTTIYVKTWLIWAGLANINGLQRMTGC